MRPSGEFRDLQAMKDLINFIYRRSRPGAGGAERRSPDDIVFIQFFFETASGLQGDLFEGKATRDSQNPLYIPAAAVTACSAGVRVECSQPALLDPIRGGPGVPPSGHLSR